MTQRFSIGNFNVRNLVPASTDAGYHFFYAPEKHNCYRDHGSKDQTPYQKKIRWLASQLDRMQCDIVCFEEVFELEPLQHVIDASSYAGKVKLYLCGNPVYREERYRGTNAKIYTHPRIAIMIHKDYELRDMNELAEFPKEFNFARKVEEFSGRNWQIQLTQDGKSVHKFNRPVLRARIRMPKRFANAVGSHRGETPEILLYAAHFKSKRPIQARTSGDSTRDMAQNYLIENAVGQARSLMLRAIEAAALRCYVLDDLTNTDTPVFLLGDLNDGPHGATTEIAGGLSLVNMPLPGLGRDEENNLAADLTMYNAYELQTRRTRRDVYYTHIHKGIHDTLDHIMVSSHFVPRPLREDVGRNPIGKIGTLRILNDHLLNQDLDDMRSERVGKYLHTRSDHGQISVRIDWREKPRAKQQN